jgi:hypothetical protein
MKNNLDLWAVIVGTTASFMKAMKNKLDFKTTFIALIVGGILAYGTLGVLDTFFSGLEPRVIMLASFAVGWVANELTDVLDEIIKDGYELFKEWFKSKFTKK